MWVGGGLFSFCITAIKIILDKTFSPCFQEWEEATVLEVTWLC